MATVCFSVVVILLIEWHSFSFSASLQCYVLSQVIRSCFTSVLNYFEILILSYCKVSYFAVSYNQFLRHKTGICSCIASGAKLYSPALKYVF